MRPRLGSRRLVIRMKRLIINKFKRLISYNTGLSTLQRFNKSNISLKKKLVFLKFTTHLALAVVHNTVCIGFCKFSAIIKVPSLAYLTSLLPAFTSVTILYLKKWRLFWNFVYYLRADTEPVFAKERILPRFICRLVGV